MKRLVFFIGLSFFLSVQATWFGYDRGIFAARSSDNERAVSLLTDELTANPDDPALLYDSGLLAYKQHKYEQAHAFFSKVVSYTDPHNQLHRQALFNGGNAFVGEKKLHEALSAYNHLLALDPSHEKARHNRDVVQKMLEKKSQESSTQESQTQDNKKQNKGQKNQQQSGNGQQQDQQQKQQDGEKNDDEANQQNAQSQSDQQNNTEKQQSGSQKSGSQGSGNENNTQTQKDSQQQKQQHDASDKHGQGKLKKCDDKDSVESKGHQKNEQGDADDASPEKKAANQESPEALGDQDDQKRDNKNSNQLDERDSYKERYGKRDNDADSKNEQGTSADKSKNVKDKTDSQEGGNEQRAYKHDGPPSQKPSSENTPLGNASTTKPMKAAGKVQDSAQKEQKKQYAAWAEAMLDTVQLNDEALNKVLVQRAVAGALGGREGECCW